MNKDEIIEIYEECQELLMGNYTYIKTTEDGLNEIIDCYWDCFYKIKNEGDKNDISN